MNWIFILNDINYGKTVIFAQNIADYLLEKKVWQYTPMTPNISRINNGDQALIYLAGKGRRYFYAVFGIQEQIKPMNAVTTQCEIWEENFNRVFKLGSSIDNSTFA